MNKYCLLCQDILPQDWVFEEVFLWRRHERPVICQACQQSFCFIQEGLKCDHCYRYLKLESQDKYHQAHQLGGKYYCCECLAWQSKLPWMSLNQHILLEFNEIFRQWIHQYKYVGDYRQAQVMRTLLKDHIKPWLAYDWITIPSSINSIKQRGFRATDHILEVLGIQPVPLLTYHGNQVRQANKNRKERMETPQVYQLDISKYNPESTYLLFDDIYTTGSTMMRAKLAIYDGLNQAGMETEKLNITSICLAREVF